MKPLNIIHIVDTDAEQSRFFLPLAEFIHTALKINGQCGGIEHPGNRIQDRIPPLLLLLIQPLFIGDLFNRIKRLFGVDFVFIVIGLINNLWKNDRLFRTTLFHPLFQRMKQLTTAQTVSGIRHHRRTHFSRNHRGTGR